MGDGALRAESDALTRAIFLGLGISISILIVSYVSIYYIYDPYNIDEIAIAIPIVSACSIFIFWKMTPWGNSKFDNFGSATLLFAFLYRIQSVFDALFFGSRLDSIPATVPLPDPASIAFLKGEAVTNIGILIIVAAWRRSIGLNLENFSFLGKAFGVSTPLFYLIYALGLSASVLDNYAPGIFGALQQVASLTLLCSIVSIYFIGSNQNKVYNKIIISLILAAPLVIGAIGSGIKESMLFPLIPAAILFWNNFRSIFIRISFVLFGLYVLALSQLYVGYVRDATWIGNEQERSGIEMLSGFIAQDSSGNFLDGFDSISSRLNLTQTHAETIAIADADGFEPFNVFGSIPSSFVPRLLWSNKPLIQPGAAHTARIRGLSTDDTSDITTATAAGFLAEMYLGGGIFGLVAGSSLFGFLLAAAQRFVLKVDPNFGHAAFSFVAVYWALRLDEKAVVYAYNGVILLVLLVMLLRLLFNNSSKKAQTQVGKKANA